MRMLIYIHKDTLTPTCIYITLVCIHTYIDTLVHTPYALMHLNMVTKRQKS